MDQHPVPRQITTFEFKLIGFMTLKQFLYLAIFFPVGFIVYKLIPIPIINIGIGVLVGVVGILFAFVPIQDRPMELWIRNLLKRLNSPTQYIYQKKNNAFKLLSDLYYASDPHLALAHMDTKEKLAQYMRTQAVSDQADPASSAHRIKQQGHIEDLLHETKHTDPATIKKGQSPAPTGQPAGSAPSPKQPAQAAAPQVKQPFITGTIHNRRNIPLPGILVTIADQNGTQLRLLKTNPHGVFATYAPLPTGEYVFSVSDPNGNYFFDTMNISVEAHQKKPITIYSKEML